jgi:hypothetical protein
MQPLPPQRVELYLNNLRGEELLPAAAEGDDTSGENGSSSSSNANRVFVSSELCRQVVLGVRQVDVQDYEIMHRYELLAPGRIRAVQRTAVYLEPRDALYFKAGGHPVAVYDYELELVRTEVADTLGRPVACVETPKDVVQCI